MRISVAICTRNRADMLRDALASVRLALPPVRSEVEVIVVDNGSTDDTEEVVAAAMPAMPVRRVIESTPGLSNARNTAVESATGDVIVWIDDDVIVDAGWLRAYELAFEQHPTVTFFGGPILPTCDEAPPRWLSDAWQRISYVYAARDLGEQPRPIEEIRDLPFGANYAIRLEAQRSVPYDPGLGRQPSARYVAGEESAVMASLLASGRTGWWVPAASVRHRIPADRSTVRYLIEHGVGLGRTMVRTGSGTGRARGAPVRSSIALWVDFLRAARYAAIARLRRVPQEWVPAVHRASVLAGKLYESMRR